MKQPLIGIIGGKGRMGKLFATFFREHGIKTTVSDLGTKLTNKELAAKSDIVIVSVPIAKTDSVVREIIPYLRPDAALMDFTSVKEEPLRTMLEAKCEVLGLHPMFGDTNPVPGQTVIFCPTGKSGQWSLWLEKFLRKNDVKIEKMTPRQHDQMMNTAQGLIHFAEITFADGLRRMNIPVSRLLRFTGKASELKVELAARLIAQDADLYGNIQIANPRAMRSLEAYKKAVDELFSIVKRKDLAGFCRYFQRDKKYFGEYLKNAYQESAYLIDKLVERRRKKTKDTNIRPDKNDLALLGPEHSFSDLAAEFYLKENNFKFPKYFARDIDEVFDLVAKGKVWEGIVPIENMIHGTIRETLDGLFDYKVHIVKTITLPIHHCLITLPHAKTSDIRCILSHPQALSQCRKYLKKHFPKASLEPFGSTSAATQKLATGDDKSIAVIAPSIAAEKFNLKVVAKNIEDDQKNSTRFILIRKGDFTLGNKTKKDEQKNRTKTSIAFYFHKDSPGTLFSVFREFADAKINLSKIESRPTKARFGEYIFYLDFDADVFAPKSVKVLSRIRSKVACLKILGSY